MLDVVLDDVVVEAGGRDVQARSETIRPRSIG